MKKKLTSLFLIISCALIFTLTSCGRGDVLLFLNWGEYIDEELIEAFEEEYNVTVNMDLGDSNEIFYSKVKSGTTVYDVVCPSDYMVEKMYEKGLLEKLDFSKFEYSGYNPQSDNIRYGVKQITNIMNQNLIDDGYDDPKIENYFVPYLWGSWGIMYSTKKNGLEEAVTNNKDGNQWASLFDRNSLPKGTKVAMYDSHQHAYYAACRYLSASGYQFQGDLNDEDVVYAELPTSDLNKIKNIVSKMNYNAWGTDTIKKQIVAENIDLGFMWTGDFLYYYAENLADIVSEAYYDGDVKLEQINDMIVSLTSGDRYYISDSGTKYDIGFDIYIPDDTIAFCDNLVMTKNAQHKDLAYKFIDFMTSRSFTYKNSEDEVNPSLTNTYYVDYDAVFNDVYDELVDMKTTTIDQAYKDEFEGSKSEFNSYLYDTIYDIGIGIGFDKYYPRDELKGSILANFSRSYIKEINKTFNTART